MGVVGFYSMWHMATGSGFELSTQLLEYSNILIPSFSTNVGIIFQHFPRNVGIPGGRFVGIFQQNIPTISTVSEYSNNDSIRKERVNMEYSNIYSIRKASAILLESWWNIPTCVENDRITRLYSNNDSNNYSNKTTWFQHGFFNTVFLIRTLIWRFLTIRFEHR